MTKQTVAAPSGIRRVIGVLDALFCIGLTIIAVGVCAAIQLR